jgi:cellulose synthase/poly-beta-1,6-N-acetylglucosamine synthase-like glycosyltransferase
MQSVSIIVPAWNEARTLKSTLDALTHVEYDWNQVEVIIVAGGDDNTYEIARKLSTLAERFSRYIVILQGNKGTKNAAIQQGMEVARNDIIVLLDADTIVSEYWLKELTHPIEVGKCDLAIANSEPVRKNWVSDYYMIIKTYFMDSITTYSGHSMAFKADMVKGKVGHFFAENVWMGDDYLFEKRVLEEGKEMEFVKSATVTTHFPWSLRHFLRIELQWLGACIHLDGPSYNILLRSLIFIGSIIFLIPFYRLPFVLALLFHLLYVSRRAHIFFVSSRQYDTRPRRIVGFVVLSYIRHMLVLISHVRYFLGLWKDPYYQGQRV